MSARSSCSETVRHVPRALFPNAPWSLARSRSSARPAPARRASETAAPARRRYTPPRRRTWRRRLRSTPAEPTRRDGERTERGQVIGPAGRERIVDLIGVDEEEEPPSAWARSQATVIPRSLDHTGGPPDLLVGDRTRRTRAETTRDRRGVPVKAAAVGCFAKQLGERANSAWQRRPRSGCILRAFGCARTVILSSCNNE
jgi:hypothetical protein